MSSNVRLPIIYSLLFAVLTSFITACGGGSDQPSVGDTGSDTPPAEYKDPFGGNYPWKKFDTPPGADPAISAEDGGAGFEDIATSLGFETGTVSNEHATMLADPKAQKGGEIRFLINRFLLSFRPFFYGQNTFYTENNLIRSYVYEGLLSINPINLETIPSLATHWKMSEDKSTYWFRINPDARWSDGKPVIAEDVVATYKLLMDETLLSPSLQQTYSKYEVPVAESKYIVSVKSRVRNWRNFLYFHVMRILPSHIIGDMTGTEFIETFHYSQPPGSGPYINLESDIIKGREYAFTRRPDWWAKDDPLNALSCNFDKVYFEIVKDNQPLQYEKFKKGESDVFYYDPGMIEQWVNDTTYDALANGWIKRYRVLNDGPVGTRKICFNIRKWPFNDIRLRKAFAHLLNREAIIEKLLYDEFIPTNSEYANQQYENPDNPKAEFNPELAQKLLAEAGWTEKNDDGILVKDGKQFSVEFAIYKDIEKFITPWQSDLRKAGIDLQLKLQDRSTLFKNTASRNFNMFYVAFGGLVFPNPESSRHSRLADKTDNNNIEGFANARVDELCGIYDTTFDRSKHVDIIREIDYLILNEQVAAYLWYAKGSCIGVWDKFGMPESVYSRYAGLQDYDEVAMSTWWYDESKVQKLEEAMQQNAKLPQAGEIIVSDYWKRLSL